MDKMSKQKEVRKCIQLLAFFLFLIPFLNIVFKHLRIVIFPDEKVGKLLKSECSLTDHLHIKHFEKKETNIKMIYKKPKSCGNLSFSKIVLPATALVSFPGSGNTWLRHLIQEATGNI